MPTLSSTKLHADTNILDQVCGAFARCIDAKPHHIVGLGLWALHTHIHRRYDKSPRLLIFSPLPNCGKSSVLNILNSIVWRPEKVIDPTPATAFALANSHTLLIDEVDNMSIVRSMKAILNAGHEIGGSVPRKIGKEVILTPVYGPLALASIGHLPVSLMSRSIMVKMHRSNKQMEIFNPREAFYHAEVARWAEGVNLNPNPLMPPQIIGRYADKWRPLIAIGHAVDRAKTAYEAMADFYKERVIPDVRESLLSDVQEIFTNSKKDAITNNQLVEFLINSDFSDVNWSDYKLSTGKLARILRDFEIENRVQRHEGKLARWYFKEDFAEMWERYA
jgi:hypothetical protein